MNMGATSSSDTSTAATSSSDTSIAATSSSDTSTAATSSSDTSTAATSSSDTSTASTSQKHSPAHGVMRTWRTLTENIAIRLITLLVYSAIGCVIPYIALYLRQLGLNAFQLGVLFTIRPVLGVFCTPIWGYIADRFKIWRIIFILSIIGSMSFGTSLIFIPTAERVPCNYAIQTLASSLGFPPYENNNSSIINNQSTITDEEYLSELKETMIKKREQESKTWLYTQHSLTIMFLEIVFMLFLYETFFAANLAFVDVSILCELDEEHESYSKFRSFGSLGWIIGCLLSASLLQLYRTTVTYCGMDFVVTDYKIAFLMMGGCYLISLPIACSITFENISNDVEYHAKEFMKLLMSPTHISVYVIGIFVGTCNGFVWYFLNYHLENLGATQLLMGIAMTVGALSEIVWGLFFQLKAVERLGHTKILVIALALYCIRFLIYAVLQNPLWILPVEIIQGASYFAVWNTLVSYTVHSFPPQFLATSISFLNAIFQNLGLGIGTFLSGYLIYRFDAATTCYIYCVASLCFLVLFIIVRRIFTNMEPEIESMNLIAKQEEEKRKTSESEQSVPAGTPPTPGVVPAPTFRRKSYSSIDDSS
ncbi:major facilitator superfamily domain-containing protein 6-like isoform X3 [Anneissia japonica]|uniref:major facilitator superfamily domain-containing protein 6-like isoform X3 n=1 Tax=Anneissia japonica TaxID=1529436 RepID=UPI001425A867|nr:major facilitator superfamily domain-containing protein 6-like isoform X3 [Anneissia japonica]